MLDFAVTRLPSHGVLKLECTTNASEANIAITHVTFRCWDFFSRYRLVWWPDGNSDEDAIIGFKVIVTM